MDLDKAEKFNYYWEITSTLVKPIITAANPALAKKLIITVAQSLASLAFSRKIS